MEDTDTRTQAKPAGAAARRRARGQGAANAGRAAAKRAATDGGETGMNKKGLIDAVVARSGVKQKEAKPVVEAVLAVLGEALAEGREMALPPLGKLKVTRNAEKPNARVIVCRLRQQRGGAASGKEALAPGGDEG